MKEEKNNGKPRRIQLLNDDDLDHVSGGLFGGYADVTRQLYGCPCCYKQFSSEAQLIAHLKSCPKTPANK